MTSRSEDKRKFTRIDKSVLVSFEVYPKGKEPVNDMGLARTVDVSVGGIQLELPRPIERDDGVKLVLNLEGNLVPVFGRVTRVEPGFGGYVLAGIRLTKVPAEYAAAIGSLAHD